MSTALRDRIEQEKASLQAFADGLDAKTGGPTAEDSAQLAQRAVALKAMVADLKAQNEARDALTDTSAFLKDLGDVPASVVKDAEEAARSAERFDDGRLVNPNGKTIGELFTEAAQYKGFVDQFPQGIPEHHKFRTQPFNIKGGLKALITGGSATSAGAAVRNDFYGPITDLVGQRPLRVVDLVTKGSTTSDTVEYVRVTGKTNNAAPFAETTNVTSSAIKAESAMTLEVVSTTVKTIAHWIPITRRAMNDAGQVRTLVDNFLRYGLEEELEDQIVAGAGTGENFTGILNSSPQTQDATTGSGGSGIDAVLSAIAKVRWTGYREPTAIVIHPNDWYSTSFLMKKDSEGRYLVGDPRASADQLNMLWGLRVVVSPAVTENSAIVGDFRQAVLWERSGINVYMTDSHSDFFVRNVFVLLAEMEAAFGVLDPQAFCVVQNL